MKSIAIISILYVAFALFAIIGEIKCIVHMVQCNWEPIGKAETIYTVGAFTGAGAIIGWIHIKDK